MAGSGRRDTRAIHAGQQPDPSSGAVMAPIVLSSTFAQRSPGHHAGYDYGRSDNPTRASLERCLAALEGGAHGLAFASGCAAMTALFQTLRPGDHVVAGNDVYGGTFRLLDQVLQPMDIHTTWADLRDPAQVEHVLRSETKLLWVETPTNPLLRLVDIHAVADVAHRHGTKVAVDNTFATPMLQRPLEHGADLVVHSTTKYINGHSDVIGGALVTDDGGLAEQLRFLQKSAGAVPSPFDCYLVLRGIKTLPVRMERHCRSARRLAAWLEERPEVEHVLYPGLSSHPQRALAERQMEDAGGMISFVVRGGMPAARRFLEATRVCTLAESLGGVESLVEHPATMTHGSMPAELRAQLGITDGLIRLSVGLEDVQDLEEDLGAALEAARNA